MNIRIKVKTAVSLIAILMCVLLVSCAAEQSFPMPRLEELEPSVASGGIIDPASEVRGVWIASVFNINFPSRADLTAAQLRGEIDAILDVCEENRLNTVFFQVRPSCDALYESRLYPVSRYLSSNGTLTLDVLEYLLSAAHARNIFVHAWINPLRVTTVADSEGTLDLSSPARIHPEWTVKYADGKVYLNAGVPEVRDFVAEGVRELVENYDVDGVVFDDYFYPYPAGGAQFDDDAEYAAYGAGFDNIGDFRRDNINKLIKSVYDTVKAADADCLFGVSPAGVWQNDDGTNGGSATCGFEAYNEIYCDAVSWVRGGYVDFISPQLYWTRESAMTPFYTLAEWWNRVLDGTSVELWISHGVYRYSADDWGDASGEMASQVELSRKLLSYRGSVFYGYDKLASNAYNVNAELTDVYRYDVIYCDAETTDCGVRFVSPYIGEVCPLGEISLCGESDPSMDLRFDGESVGRQKDGSFHITVEISEGENRFVFTQGEREYILTVYGE